MPAKNTTSTIEYRLSSIEATLVELKTVVVENKLQARDIKDIEKTLEKTMALAEENKAKIENLEARPNNEKAEKWQMIADYIFKALLVALGALVASKIGLK